MSVLKAFSCLSLSVGMAFSVSCSGAPSPGTPSPSVERVGDAQEEKAISIRELDSNGQIRIRRVHPDELLREAEVRVFQLKYIYMHPAEVRPGSPGAIKLEDWEVYAVLDSLLTRDIQARKIGSLNYDRECHCFIVRDSSMVLDRIGDLLSELEAVEMEREHVARVLLACDGNQARAAEVLGVPRTTLRTKLESHGLLSLAKPEPSAQA